jgi:hypothetical protein
VQPFKLVLSLKGFFIIYRLIANPGGAAERGFWQECPSPSS